jgi:hypothetical protein
VSKITAWSESWISKVLQDSHPRSKKQKPSGKEGADIKWCERDMLKFVGSLV